MKLFPFVIFKKRGRSIAEMGILPGMNEAEINRLISFRISNVYGKDYTFRIGKGGFSVWSVLRNLLRANYHYYSFVIRRKIK